ncbi:hypothetical protein [Enhygromyxa salina]|uniref:Tetratricopeptide repeat protein n=1 Tax=Enhygromyxa salina TaxID=215803 RepID=A0A2S9YNQ1_9BACT|nr:hypothetical protein [Enhygromyxa salina]PRQ06704.1 hypothetical protein ENSA7_35800 [Enhygromyxa salina]
MSEGLPPVLAGELDRWVRELSADAGGLLMIAVGVSARRRVAVEAGLRAALEGWRVVDVTIEGACSDPWAPVLASVARGAARTLVSLSGLGDCDDPDRTLAALNLGREHLRRGSMSLVLWTGSLEDLDRVRRKAPDLWSYRRRVGLFLSAEDVDRGSPEIDEREIVTKGIEQLRGRLDSLEPDDPHRVQLLLPLISHLHALGDKDAAAAALDSAASLIGEDSPEVVQAGLLNVRARSATSFERFDEILALAGRVDWTALDSLMAYEAAYFSVLCFKQRRKFRDADRASEAVRRLSTLVRVPGRASSFAVNGAAMWLLLGDLPRARQRCMEATEALGDRWAYDASFIAMRRAEIADAQLETHVALTFLHEAWTLQSRMGAAGSAAVASWLVAAFHGLGLFDDAEQLGSNAIAQQLHSFEQTVALGRQLVRTQACLDLKAAQETHRELREQLDRRITTCPAWERAMLRRARVTLLRLAFELEPAREPELRLECLDTLDLAIRDAIDQRQFDLAQWARLQQVELTRNHQLFDRSLALGSTALDWATEHEGPSRVAECHIELAVTHRAANCLDAATEQLDAAERVLSSDDPRYQPRATWKRLLIERHHVALALDDPPTALAHLEQALTRMRAASLRKLELELLHLVAELPELPDHPSTNARREQAAREALELARDAYLVFEQARALANLAIIQHAQAPQRARRHLDDALTLAPSCVLEPAHNRMREAERALAG